MIQPKRLIPHSKPEPVSINRTNNSVPNAEEDDRNQKIRNEIMDHPLLPYILKANNDLRGDSTPYTPISEVWQNETQDDEITNFLLEYLKLVEIQVNRVDKLVESAQEYCDRMLETFPESQHITKRETAKKRKKRAQPNINIANPAGNAPLLAYGLQFPPMFAHPMAPEALLQSQLFNNQMFMNPTLQAYNANLLNQMQANAENQNEYVNVEENLDCINTEITKTD